MTSMTFVTMIGPIIMTIVMLIGSIQMKTLYCRSIRKNLAPTNIGVALISTFVIISQLGRTPLLHPPVDDAHFSACQNLIVPAYYYPYSTSSWDSALASYPTLGMMIVNPASGPGTTIDPNYVGVIAKARATGIKLLGYVTSSYATKPAAAFETEVSRWFTMYGIKDIFIDEVASDVSHLSYYYALSQFVKMQQTGATVVINPGQTIDESYVTVADIMTVFEGDYSTYLSADFPAWVNRYPASLFLHLIYDVPNQTALSVVLELSQRRNAGSIYVTDRNMPNPWDGLASYWKSEVGALNFQCAPVTPFPTKSATSGNLTPQPLPQSVQGRTSELVCCAQNGRGEQCEECCGLQSME
jgi:hypothetical protein